MFFNLTPHTTMNWLYKSLVTERKTLKEFDIIQTWKKQHWLPRHCMSTELLLFRTHFYIFHQIYILKRRLLTKEQGDIEIHTLGIFYSRKDTEKKEKKTAATHIKPLNSLLHYYLDWKPLFETNTTDIHQLMQFARSGISQPYQLQRAFKHFQLTPPINEKAIKTAYRKLAMKHHPDKGGRIQDIQKVNEHKSLIMSWLQHQQSFK